MNLASILSMLVSPNAILYVYIFGILAVLGIAYSFREVGYTQIDNFGYWLLMTISSFVWPILAACGLLSLSVCAIGWSIGFVVGNLVRASVFAIKYIGRFLKFLFYFIFRW